MSGTLLLVALLLATQAPASPTPARPAPSRPGLSWEEADSVTRVLRRIDRRLRSGRPASRDTIVVTEGQLNSFVNLTLAEKIPPEMSDLELRLLQDRLAARARLDLDELRAKMPEGGAASLLSMLTGVVPVVLSGRVESAEGLVRLDLEEVLIGGVGLPPALLAQAVSLATRDEERPDGVDITAPVALPWTARRVRIRPGRALFDFYY
jgi:hypothetical protein